MNCKVAWKISKFYSSALHIEEEHNLGQEGITPVLFEQLLM